MVVSELSVPTLRPASTASHYTRMTMTGQEASSSET